MNMQATIGNQVGQIVGEAIRIARSAMLSMSAYVVVVTLGGMYVDQTEDWTGPNLFVNLLTLVLGYWMVTSMLRNGGLAPRNLAAGFGAYFGLSLLCTFAYLIGFALLIIPGFVLMVRWAPVYGFALVDGDGIIEAMGKSWTETGEFFAPIALAMIGPFLLAATTLAIYVLTGGEYGLVAVGPSFVANLGISLAGVALTAIGLAAYSILSTGTDTLTEVFE